MVDPGAEFEAELARVAARESTVRAWVERRDDDELRAAFARLPAGPLQGWTLGVKDVIDTADLPTRRGSPIYRDRTTTTDAACVALARQAGALPVGKTATTEFALFTPTVTTNPHDPERTPGGSSSGSAAAVADGMVRAAFGTQTVGSVLRPAAFCGVVGFKPTHGLVPPTGVASLAPSFDTVGWLTRSVDDADTLATALTGVGRGSSTLDPGRPLRLGRYRSHQWEAARPEMGGVLDDAADRLTDGSGDRGFAVVEIDPLPHLERVFEAADVVLHYEVARVFAWERAMHFDLISPAVQTMFERADGIGGDEIAAAQHVLAEARAAHSGVLRDHRLDALLTPSAPGEAPPLRTTGNSVFNRTWTSLGVPAIHLPTGRGPAGLPVGIQLTGHAWGDADLLSIAREAEAALG